MNGLIIDNFAGGGGASTGIESALGRAVDIAINHDEEAIRMHEVNHPSTVHNQAHRLFRLLRFLFLPPSAFLAALTCSPAGQFSGARFSSRHSFVRRRDKYSNAGLLLGSLQTLSRQQPRHSPCAISSLRTGRFEWPSRNQTTAAV